MAFPMCVLAAILLQRRHYGRLGLLLIAYLGIGFPISTPAQVTGPAILLYMPRLILMLAVLAGIYALLWRRSPSADSIWDWEQYVWAAAMLAFAALSVLSTFRLETAVRREFAYRVPSPAQSLLNAYPLRVGSGIACVAMTPNGYRLAYTVGNVSPVHVSADELSFTYGRGQMLVERAGTPYSSVVAADNPSRFLLADAREPMLSADAQDLAFVRDNYGRGQLMLRRSFRFDADEIALTPPRLNVYEASFLSEKQYAFSAVEGDRPPQIYLTDAAHSNVPLTLGESRYPALSPDGNWMAYSHLDHGMWNLWLRNQRTGANRRISNVPCNQMQPAWESDSKTLLYAVDCGRGLWLTAVARRRVIP
jgi:hypothetical protein